jgi:predicted O-methyltransferase YrrM
MGTLVEDKLNLYVRRTLPRESVKFAKKYFKNKPIDCIEIGVSTGIHAESIYKMLNVKKLFLIDPYSRYEEWKHDALYKSVFKNKLLAHKRLKRYNKKNVWVENYSEKVVKQFKNNSLDFIYVDGNHIYDYVKKDLELYWDKVKTGGILAGHDIYDENVSRAVIDFVKEKDLDVQFGDKADFWIIKRKL